MTFGDYIEKKQIENVAKIFKRLSTYTMYVRETHFLKLSCPVFILHVLEFSLGCMMPPAGWLSTAPSPILSERRQRQRVSAPLAVCWVIMSRWFENALHYYYIYKYSLERWQVQRASRVKTGNSLLFDLEVIRLLLYVHMYKDLFFHIVTTVVSS